MPTFPVDKALYPELTPDLTQSKRKFLKLLVPASFVPDSINAKLAKQAYFI
jgi:hypothetical protein